MPACSSSCKRDLDESRRVKNQHHEYNIYLCGRFIRILPLPLREDPRTVGEIIAQT